MIRLVLLAWLAMLLQAAQGQQLPQLTQYNQNDYVFNPAVAGSRPFFEMRTAHRYQWVGIQDAPRTFVLSAHSPVGRSMGLGGYLFTDIVGPTRRTGVQFTYAYHLRLTEELKLSLAASAGVLQFLIDGSKIQLHDPGDPAMDQQLRGEVTPDAQFAFHLYHQRYWFGAAVPQLLRNQVYFFDRQQSTLTRMEPHIYAMGGYRQPLGEDWAVEPSVLVKYVDPVPLKWDLTATLRYRNAMWLGVTYRTNDAVCAMLGYWLKESFQFSYSYDVITSNLMNYSAGSHEISLAVTIGKRRPVSP